MVYHVQFPGLGLDLTVNRVALAIGGFNIYWYGVIIAAGMLLAMLYAFRNAVDYGIDSDRLVDVVAIGTVMAIVCASPSMARSSARLCSAPWPPNGARCRCCRCLIWCRWAF